MSTLHIPFRHDHVGSFLRPARLKDARIRYEAGSISAEQLKQIEDEEIAALIEKQKQAGCLVITDGEFRRSYWHLDFMWGFQGIQKIELDHGYFFHGEETTPGSIEVIGKISGEDHPFVEHDFLLTAVFGGVITGLGTGLLLLCHATTGGTDTVAVLLHKRALRHVSIAVLLQVLDGIIVAAGIPVFGIVCAAYAVIAVFCLGKVSDGIVAGVHYSKIAYVISDRKDEIAKVIMDRLGRGVTDIRATGMYTGARKDILFCVVSPKEIVEVKEIAAAIDPRAFIIITDAKEVRGEGFAEHEQD